MRDSAELTDMLHSNRGAKEDIRSIRVWVISRAHSIMAIGVLCGQFAASVAYNRYNYARGEAFNKLMYLIYVLNDVFFNADGVVTKGLYTSLLPSALITPVDVIGGVWPQLTHIMNNAYGISESDIDREKLFKIISLWESKGFRDHNSCAALKMQMTLHPQELGPHPLPHLTPPYALNLPPAFPAPKPSAVAGPLGGLPNLHEISVGAMSNLVRAALKSGHQKRYQPIEISGLLTVAPPVVEPGRLEARLKEYYRAVEDQRDL
jgi:hypothetical protein